MYFFRLQELPFSYVLRITFLHILYSTINNNLRYYLPHFTDKEAGRGKILVQNQRTSYQSKIETQLLSAASSHICLKMKVLKQRHVEMGLALIGR